MDTLPGRTWKERTFVHNYNSISLPFRGKGGGGGGRGAVDSEFLVGGVWLGFPNHDPIPDQSM